MFFGVKKIFSIYVVLLDIFVNSLLFGWFLLSYGESTSKSHNHLPPMQKISFAINHATGELVETGGVVSGTPALIQQAVTDLFSENSTSKCWLYHPREVEVRKRLQQNLFVVQAGVARQIEAPTQVKQPQPQILACKMCKSKWLSNPGEPIICKTCNTHLYVVMGIE